MKLPLLRWIWRHNYCDDKVMIAMFMIVITKMIVDYETVIIEVKINT